MRWVLERSYIWKDTSIFVQMEAFLSSHKIKFLDKVHPGDEKITSAGYSAKFGKSTIHLDQSSTYSLTGQTPYSASWRSVGALHTPDAQFIYAPPALTQRRF